MDFGLESWSSWPGHTVTSYTPSHCDLGPLRGSVSSPVKAVIAHLSQDGCKV